MIKFQKLGAELAEGPLEESTQFRNNDLFNISAKIKEKLVITSFQSGVGDHFRFEETFVGDVNFDSTDCATSILSLAQRLQAKESYQLLEDTKQIYLRPDIFWQFFKSNEINKRIVSVGLKSRLKLFVNDEQYRFVPSNFYFDEDQLNRIGESKGIYGIFYNDQLLYIGSSNSGVVGRWKEHDKKFRTICSEEDVSMYADPHINPDEVSYQLLISSGELQELLDQNIISGWILEDMERRIIENIKPFYNKCGVTKNFVYAATKNKYSDKDFDDTQDYWPILKQFLLDNERLDSKFFTENVGEKSAE